MFKGQRVGPEQRKMALLAIQGSLGAAQRIIVLASAFSVTLQKDKNLNDLFKSQELEVLNVKNIRNQTNRLEELFVKLTSKNE